MNKFFSSYTILLGLIIGTRYIFELPELSFGVHTITGLAILVLPAILLSKHIH